MAVALDQFVKQLADSGVIAPGKLESFVPPKAHPKDAQELAQQLVQSKQLTKFQAQEIYQGRAKSLILGNYTILDKIGAGGMGQVFKAQHRRMERTVAIKMLPKNVMMDAVAAARFQREVVAAAKLSHTNIVAAYDADEAGGAHFLAMEYVEGNDLSALVKKNGPFSLVKVVNCILQAARGLEYAHKHGVIHRDIKPANLLLDRDGTIKILDMGLARIEGGGDTATQAELTGTGAVMGTVDYMAPEQALSTHHADARADIYSLGCTLHYLLTGRATYKGDTLMAKLLAHREHSIPSLGAEVPEPIQTMFEKMVAKDVVHRYQSMSDVVADLEKYSGGLPTSLSIQQTIGHRSSSDIMTFLKNVTLNTLHKPKTTTSPASTNKILKLVIGAVATGILGMLILAAIFKMRTKDGTPEPAKSVTATVNVGPPNQPWNTPAFQQWIKAVAALPADRQVEAVAKELQDLNPGFDGKVTGFDVKDTMPKIENGAVTEFGFRNDDVIDISPVRALSELTSLRCGTEDQGNGRLADLSPLRGMKLSRLACGATQVADLSPLREMSSLTELSCGGTQVSDLSPLKGLPLTSLHCGRTLVSDLAPLAGMGLTDLHFNDTSVSDLSPVKGMPLTILSCANTGVSDLSVLKGMKLTTFYCNKTTISDLSPLRGMPLTKLCCDDTQVSDLSPLEGMKLNEVAFTPNRIRVGLEVLQKMPSLQLLRSSWRSAALSPSEFWNKYDVGGFGKPESTQSTTELSPPPARSPFDVKQARAYQEAWAKYLGTQVETTNSNGMRMVLLPPGEFQMGSTDEQVAAALKTAVRLGENEFSQGRIRDAERPRHKVVLTKPMAMSATVVTIGQFRKFIDATNYATVADKFGGDAEDIDEKNPGRTGRTWRTPEYAVTDESPVTEVTWLDAAAFCNWLCLREKLPPSYQNTRGAWVPLPGATGYRLPSEAQWEYACRAGTTTQYWFGDNPADLADYGWYEKNSGGSAHAVGLKPANPFGLYDMHGNVEEWCADMTSDHWYSESPTNDPEGPQSGPRRIVRGGNWHYNASLCRSAMRNDCNGAMVRHSNLGFRVVRTLEAMPDASATTPTTPQPPATSTAGPATAPVPAPATMPEPPLTKDSRIPIPDDASRTAAEKLFQELFHADLMQAKLPEQKAALAGKFLRQADAARNDPTSRYVMLQESLRLSADAADMAILGRAIDSLARTYVVDASLMWFEALEKSGQKPRSPVQNKRLAEAALDQADEAAADDNYELATRFQSVALAAAQKSHDAAFVKNVVGLGKSLVAAKQQWNAAQQADSALAKTPGDAAANLALGKYLCFTKGEWKQGFVRLAKGSDPVLANLAIQSLANPKNPAAQEALGDAWWKAAEATKGSAKAEFLEMGCGFWYSKALPRLVGLAKSKVEGRLHSLPALSSNAAKPALRRWMRDVAALPAEQQVDAVAKKLQELNPGFEGNETHKVEDGAVTELKFVTDNVTDISPVRALAGLKSLTCNGSRAGRGVLSDLSPLKGMSLTFLDCGWSRVSDLSPLEGMPLMDLRCGDTQIVDLSPLKGMPLTALSCGINKVSDLSPLKGMPLTSLNCERAQVSDLSPLQGVPLTSLNCSQNPRIPDLKPLKGMRLTDLSCNDTNVSDLSPLKGMPLTKLYFDATKISDLSPLAGMKLNDVSFTPGQIRVGMDVLRRMPSVQALRITPFDPAESPALFWSQFDAGKLNK